MYDCVHVHQKWFNVKTLAFGTTMMASESCERWNLWLIMGFCSQWRCIIYDKTPKSERNISYSIEFQCQAILRYFPMLQWEFKSSKTGSLWILFENCNDILLFISFNHWIAVSFYMEYTSFSFKRPPELIAVEI